MLSDSIIERSSVPVSLTAIKCSQLPLTRGFEGSTEFSITRFLVPWLCGFEGIALFMDCDMLVLGDIAELFALKDDTAVQVVQHAYVPKDETKFYGQEQKVYPKKNWSSVMLFDCAQCTALTPEYVDIASGMELHQFHWARSVGSLPATWNHLVGEYEKRPGVNLIHWTNGGPWLTKYSGVDYAREWAGARHDMMHYLDDQSR